MPEPDFSLDGQLKSAYLEVLRQNDELRAERDSLRDQRDQARRDGVEVAEIEKAVRVAAEARVEALEKAAMPFSLLPWPVSSDERDVYRVYQARLREVIDAPLAAARPEQGEFRCEPDESAGQADRREWRENRAG